MLIYLIVFALFALTGLLYYLFLRPKTRIRHGYKQYVDADGKWKYEHRRVAEEKVGGEIFKGRVVHHIDGNKQNNDPSNLRVMPSGKHRKLHKKIRWAKKYKNRKGKA